MRLAHRLDLAVGILGRLFDQLALLRPEIEGVVDDGVHLSFQPDDLFGQSLMPGLLLGQEAATDAGNPAASAGG